MATRVIYGKRILLFLILPLHFCPMKCGEVNLEPSGALQLCPGSIITFNCTNSIYPSELLSWGANDVVHVFFDTDQTESEPFFIGNFSVLLISTSPELVSTATLTSGFAPQQNGTNLTCANTIASDPSPPGGDYAFLTIKDPPAAPTSPEFLLHSLTHATLFWLHPNDSACIISYTVILINITEGNIPYVYSTINDTTNFTVFDLAPGVEYSFTVAGVDAGDRSGEESMPSDAVTVDTPKRVTGLSIDSWQNRISLTWEPPPPSSRPPMRGYKIMHNTTGQTMVYETNDTVYAFEDLKPGLYSFSVLAFNILGNGEQETVSGIIPESNTDSTPQMSSAPQVSSTSISTPTETSTVNMTNIYIFAALGIIALIVTIMSILLFVLLVISIKNRKGSRKTSEPSFVKESLPDHNMSFSENQAYSCPMQVPMESKSFDNCIKSDPLYETLP